MFFYHVEKGRVVKRQDDKSVRNCVAIREIGSFELGLTNWLNWTYKSIADLFCF